MAPSRVNLPPEALDQVVRAMCSLSGVRREMATRRLTQISPIESADIHDMIAGIREPDFLDYIGVLSRLVDKEQAADNVPG